MPSPEVMYIVGQLEAGGAEQQLYYLLKYLRPRGLVVSLSGGGYWAGPIKDLGYRVIELERGKGLKRVRRLMDLVHLIRRFSPDIVHVFMDGTTGLYGRWAAVLTNHRCVIVSERRHPSLDSWWYSWIKRVALNRHVNCIVTNAKSSMEHLIKCRQMPAEKVRYIPNGLELDIYARRQGKARAFLVSEGWEKSVVIGMTCSLREKKAPQCFVRVARRIVDRIHNVKFVHIGDGPLRSDVEDLRRRLGLEEHVALLGFHSEARRYLDAMDIFVLTSRNEGMPNAVMEAMAAGLPCVVTDAGDCAVLIKSHESGYVVPIDDEEELADRLLVLIRDEKLRRQMGERAREYVGRYDVTVMAEQYRELYKELLCNAGKYAVDKKVKVMN